MGELCTTPESFREKMEGKLDVQKSHGLCIQRIRQVFLFLFFTTNIFYDCTCQFLLSVLEPQSDKKYLGGGENLPLVSYQAYVMQSKESREYTTRAQHGYYSVYVIQLR